MTQRQNDVPPQLGKRLMRERERRGWSMRDAAAKCGVSAATVCRIEQGNDGALSSVIALSSLLGLSLDALLAATPCPVCDGTPPAGFICGECRRGEAA